MNTESLMQSIRTQKCEMFSERETCGEAFKYAKDLLSGENPAAVTTALMVYHNTLIEGVTHILNRHATTERAQDSCEALEVWSCAAAQELQDILDDALDSGSDQPGIRALLDEHNQIMSKILEVNHA